MSTRFGETIDISSPFFAPLTGDEAVLAQAVIMRLSTKTGTLWTDPTYGLSLADFVRLGLTATELARIPYAVKAQLELDERIDSAEVSASTMRTGASVSLVLAMRITPSRAPTFSLTVAADSEGLVEQILKGGS